MKKRILFYLNRFPGIGGIERITHDLAESFIYELNYDVGIFSVCHEVGIEYKNNINGIKLFGASDLLKNQNSSSLEETISQFKPDIVIFQDSYAPVEDAIIALKDKYKFKLITVEHNTPNCLSKDYLIRSKEHSLLHPIGFIKRILSPYVYFKIKIKNSRRHKKLIKASDRYVVLSETYKNLLPSCRKSNWDNIIAIPNFKNDFGEKLVANSEKKKQVLFVGRLTAQKGIKYLIDIWSKIEPKYKDWNLIVAGDGELREYLENEISKRGLQRIQLLGFRTDVNKLYEESAALFMTSVFEGFPLVLAEAMQFGVVPFAFDSFTAVHDIIDDNSGFIIRSFNINDYIKAFGSFISFVDIPPSYAIEKSKNFRKSIILDKWKSLLEQLK